MPQLIIPSISIGVIVSTLLLLFYRHRPRKFSFTYSPKNSFGAPDAFQRWVEIVEKRLSRANSKLNAVKYIAFVACFSLFFFLTSLFLLKNFTASVFLAAATMVIPDHILSIITERKRRKMMDQMAAAIRIFTAEYIHTPQLERGFLAIAERVGAPVGKIFRNAYSDLVIGQNADYVLAALLAKIDIDHGRMFVQLLRQARSDASVSRLFSDLLGKMERHLELYRQNQSALAGERLLALVMALIPVPAFMFMRSFIPETTEFLVETFVGRTMITCAFASILIWALLDKIMGRVDV